MRLQFPHEQPLDQPDGLADGELRAAGSYLHNAFHNDLFRAEWLNRLRKKRGLPERGPVSTTAAKEAAYDALAAQARKNLDIDYIVKEIMRLTKAPKEGAK